MEQEAAHRRAQDRRELDLVERQLQASASGQRDGRRYGLWITLAVLALAAFALQQGHPRSAVAIATVNLVGLVTVFITGRPRRSKADGDSEDEATQAGRSSDLVRSQEEPTSSD